MKTLLLLRHAKSDRSAAVGSDFDRPLNKRGRKAAPVAGKAIGRHGLTPELVLVSAAVRTRQTWDLVAPELKAKPAQVEFREDLYLAPAARILRILQAAQGEPNTILIVGHNPGLEDLAQKLASGEQDEDGLEALGRVETKFPTAALAVFTFERDTWREVTAGSGALRLFLTPSRSEA